MAKAVFHRDFHYSSRIRNAGWSVKAGPEPQTLPRELIEAAVKAGVAEAVIIGNDSQFAQRSPDILHDEVLSHPKLAMIGPKSSQ